MIWNIATITSAVIFSILCIVVFLNINKLKYQTAHKDASLIYKEDSLVTENNVADNYNRIYINDADSNQLMDKYIISEELEKSYLICHLAENIPVTMRMKIKSYDISKRLINTLLIEPNEIITHLPPIELPHKTVYVNIGFEDMGGIQEKPVLKDRSHRDFKRLSFLVSSTLFFFMIPLGYLMLKALSGPQFEIMMNKSTVLLGLTVMVVISIINHFILLIWYKTKNRSGR